MNLRVESDTWQQVNTYYTLLNPYYHQQGIVLCQDVYEGGATLKPVQEVYF